MKNKLLSIVLAISILSLIALKAQSQSLLSFQVDSTSGDTSKITMSQKLFGDPTQVGLVGHQVSFQLTKMGSIYFMSLVLQTGGTSPFSIDPGKNLIFSLSDNTTVTLINTQPTVAQFDTQGYGYQVQVSYLILKPDLIRLSNVNIDSMQIGYNGGTFNYDIADDRSQMFMSCASLAL